MSTGTLTPTPPSSPSRTPTASTAALCWRTRARALDHGWLPILHRVRERWGRGGTAPLGLNTT
eukprot:scaffold88308_cov48-Phaeocystis_antarctica.AAC.3